ncbi:MAG: radical SAM protein [Candidatus Moranbacteria bacterium]|nr:radical SAM protein [Candidatus Moranbacteria bacterium]
MDILLSGKKFETIADPRLVIAVLEPRCNLKCSHCYWNHDGIDYGKRTHDWSRQIEKIVSWNADVAYAGRILTPRAAEFIKEYCERSGKKVGIVDNGYTILSHPELFKYYEYVNISLDGVPEDHDRQRNKKGSFEIALAAIRKMNRIAEERQDEVSREALRPVVSATFSPLNIDQWEQFEGLLTKENIAMSCNPVLGVQENFNRNMPLFDAEGIREAFKKVVGGMPKLINLYDPKHVEPLLPLLKRYDWTIRQEGDALRTELENGTVIVYKPLSVQTFGERTLLWTGNFHADADVADAKFAETATEKHLLAVANRFADAERRLVQTLLKRK